MDNPLTSLVRRANSIATFINNCKIFKNGINIMAIQQELSYNINFNLDHQNYSSALYYLSPQYKLVGKILSVNSTFQGSKIGSFLFQLHLLLSVLSNVTQLELDNYTDEPVRAAGGIYKDFNWKISKKDSKGKTEDEKAQMSEGEMIWLPHGNNRAHILNELVNIAKYVDVDQNRGLLMESPWGDNITSKIVCFNYHLHQTFGGKNSKRKTRNIRRKTRNIRRKTRNIRRKTRNIRRNFK